jgi:hypothetical protein
MNKILLFNLFFLASSLTLFAQNQQPQVSQHEANIRSYLDAGKTDAIEGIYKSMSGAYFRLAIKKTSENKYEATVLDMDPRIKKNWKIGDVKAYLEKTAVADLYSIRWIWNDKTPQETVGRFQNDGILKLDDAVESLKYVKIYPVTSTN